MRPDGGRASRRLGLASLILANLGIALLAATRSWGYYETLIVYWLEAVVIGGYNILRLLVVGLVGDQPFGAWLSRYVGFASTSSRLVYTVLGVAFFAVHFGAFAIVVGLWVLVVPAAFTPTGGSAGGEVWEGLRSVGSGVGFAVGLLILSHGFSFVRNFILGREYARRSILTFVVWPYARLALVALVLGLGLGVAFLQRGIGATTAFAIAMVLLKTAADGVAHLRERRTFQTNGQHQAGRSVGSDYLSFRHVTMRTSKWLHTMATALWRSMLTGGIVAAAACGNTLRPDDPTDIGAWMELYRVPGASVAVIRDFTVAYVEVHGIKSETTLEPVTEQTLFQAASISKSVSAMAVMRLVQDGVVELDRNVNDYLTSWAVPYNAYQATEKVTVRRLLSHTAGTTVPGFRGYRYGEPRPTLVQILNGQYPANSPPVVVDRVPGTALRYSGGGYEIVEQVVRDVTGTDFSEFMWEQVLAPLDMVHSTYRQPIPDSLLEATASGYYADGTAVPGRHHVYPEMAAAALWTTATDVARFLIEVQLSLRGESNRVLSRASSELLVTEVMDDHSLAFYERSIRGQPYLWHAAANDGFRGGMAAHLTAGHGIVVLTNSDNGLELTEALIEVIGKRENWPGF